MPRTPLGRQRSRGRGDGKPPLNEAPERLAEQPFALGPGDYAGQDEVEPVTRTRSGPLDPGDEHRQQDAHNGGPHANAGNQIPGAESQDPLQDKGDGNEVNQYGSGDTGPVRPYDGMKCQQPESGRHPRSWISPTGEPALRPT